MKRTAAALIDESRCIGCTLCIDACPVDAIVGAQGLMHTVVEPWCIGCDLCLPACPVDCIDMVVPHGPWTPAHQTAAKQRVRERKRRLERRLASRAVTPEQRKGILAAALARKKR